MSMKTLFKSLASLALLAACALGADLQNPYSVPSLQYALSNTTYIGEVATTNVINARVIELVKGRGLSLSAILVGTNAATTTNIMFTFVTSVDGTNYTTETKSSFPVILSPNGTTKVVTYTNISANALDNARYLKLLSITNGNLNLAKGVFLTNIIVGISP